MNDALPLLLGVARLLPSALGLTAVTGAGGVLASAWLLALLPLVQPASSVTAPFALRLSFELALGVAFALALCAPVLAAKSAGRMLELGFGPGMLPPHAIGRAFGVAVLALVAALGGLRLWSRALTEVPFLPPPTGDWLALATAAGSFVTQLLRLSLLLAAPAWVAFVSLDLAAAWVQRLSGGPGRAIVGVSTPLRFGSVVVALPLALERLPEWLRVSTAAAVRWAKELLT